LIITTTVLILAGIASALQYSPSSVSITANHDSVNNPISFIIINNDLAQNLTSVVFTASDLSSASGTIGSGNITKPGTIVLASGTQSSLTAYVNVPAYQAPDTYTGTLTATGIYNNGTQVTTALTMVVNVSTASSVSLSTIPSMSKSTNKTSFTITNNGNTDLNGLSVYASPIMEDSDDNMITLAFTPSSLNLNKGQSATVNITATFPSDLAFNSYSTTVYVSNPSVNVSTGLTISSDFCEYGQLGSDITITSVKDRSDVEDDWSWYPNDDVEIEVKVKNNNDDKKDIVVAYYLKNGDEIDDEDTITINENDHELITFKFKVPSDISSGNYQLFIKAYEEDEEDTQCKDYVQNIKIKQNTRDVIVDLNSISAPNQVTCGENVELTVKIVNIGKQNEDKVKVRMYNSELGIDLYSSGFSLDSGKSKKVIFSFAVPKNISEKLYDLSFITYYKYDKDDDEYDEESDTSLYTVRVAGNCQASVKSADVSISAALDSSQAIVGQEIVVRATLLNTGDTTNTYVVDTSGLSWASNIRVDPKILSIDAGKTKDVLISLTPSAGTAGSQSFTITVTANGKTEERQVALTIENKGFFSGITGGAIASSLGENWFIYLIIVLDVVLILAIILIARKVSKSRNTIEY